MKALALIVTLAIGILVAPLAAEAQEGKKVPRIGVLTAGDPRLPGAFREGLRELGYVQGQDIAIEWPPDPGRADRYPDLVAALLRLQVDVIVAGNNAAIAAAQQATKTVPIIMLFPSDPVGLGFIASLARPGGNITGLTSLSTELQAKRTQLLKEAVPTLSRVAILWDFLEPGRRETAGEAERSARALGLQPQLFEVQSPGELDSAFAAMTREGVGAVLVGGTTLLFNHRARIAELAAKNGLPTMCTAGGMSRPVVSWPTRRISRRCTGALHTS